MNKQTMALDIAQASTITSAALAAVLAVVAALVGLVVYRTRRVAAHDNGYRELAERANAAELKVVEAMQASVNELRALREGLQAANEELRQVRQRVAALGKLLSQIG